MTNGDETLGNETSGDETLAGVPESSSSASEFSSISILKYSLLFERIPFAELSPILLIKAMIRIF